MLRFSRPTRLLFPAQFIIVSNTRHTCDATLAGHTGSSWNRLDDDGDWSLRRSCQLYSFIINTVIIGTIVVGGVTGNSLAFVVFWKDNVNTLVSFLFQGMSLINSALLLTFFLVHTMLDFVGYTGWLQGYREIFLYLYVCLLHVKVIVLVAVKRYIAVCLPYKARQLCTVLWRRNSWYSCFFVLSCTTSLCGQRATSYTRRGTTVRHTPHL